MSVIHNTEFVLAVSHLLVKRSGVRYTKIRFGERTHFSPLSKLFSQQTVFCSLLLRSATFALGFPDINVSNCHLDTKLSELEPWHSPIVHVL
jgi:hypothetical protein